MSWIRIRFKCGLNCLQNLKWKVFLMYFNFLILIIEDENVTIFAAGKNLLNKILSLSITSDK